jgi:two-component system, OmpR family, phosphate regulon sensor histidine kinase PhoR
VKSFFFKTSLRIAGFTSLIVFGILFSFFSFQFGAERSIVFSILFTFLNAFLIYGISNFIIKERLQRINEDIQRIRQKKFDELDTDFNLNRDELDDVIHQLMLSSETIEKELKRLKKIENYRKEFIGDVSHELKTPIFAIQGFIETLLDGAIEDESVNKLFLKKALRNVNRLIFLTNDLLEISKLEAGELKIQFEEFNLGTAIYEVVESLHFKAEEEKVELSMSEVSDMFRIRADKNHFKQIMINLVENAIKYNRPEGSVIIGAKPYPQQPEKILIYIKDSGIGIDKKHIKRVTERFFRVDKSRSREKGGTGLGLSIVKHTIEAHGEQLFIESTTNVGSTFSFTVQNAQPKNLN